MDKITAKEAREITDTTTDVIEYVYESIRSYARDGYTSYDVIFYANMDTGVEERLIKCLKEDGFKVEEKESDLLEEDVRSVYQICW